MLSDEIIGAVLRDEDARIRSMVRSYQARAGKRYPDNTEDLYQEARMAL